VLEPHSCCSRCGDRLHGSSSTGAGRAGTGLSVVLADREAVLTHEHMSACAPSGFRSSRTKKSGCPLTFLVVKGVLYSGASGQGSHARVRHGPRGSDKPRLLGASLHDAGGRRYAIPVRGRSRRGSRARSERSELDSSWAAGGDPRRISTGTTPGVDTGNASTARATDQLSFKASPLVGSRALPVRAGGLVDWWQRCDA
jgi:hypothetical protein